MPKIKICGITSSEDAALCYKLGVDYIGFIFFPKSPRNITPEKAAGIKSDLAVKGIIKWTPVGVFVNEQADTIFRIRDKCNLFGVQLHGSESPEFCSKIMAEGIYTIKCVNIKDEMSLVGIGEYNVDAFLFDTYKTGEHGGTGQTFNHDLIIPYTEKYRIFLAGGLSPENISGILNKVKPFAVDISSGVEKTKGVKDHQKITDFVSEVKKYD